MTINLRRFKSPAFSTRTQLLTSQALGQLLPLSATPILTRLLTPVQMGEYQLALSTALVALPFATLQADVFIPVARDKLVVRALIHRSIATTIMFASLAALFSSALHNPTGIEVGATTFLLVVNFSLISLSNAALIRANDISTLIKRNIFGGGISSIAQVAFAMYHPSSISLGLAMLLGRLTSQLMIKSCSTRLIDHKAFEAQSSFWRGLVGSSANALGTLASQLPILLLAPFYGQASIGHLGLGQRVVGAPVSLIGQAVNQSIVSEASLHLRSDSSGLLAGLRRYILILLSLSLISGVTLTILAPVATPIAFGPLWEPAGKYIQILALPMSLQLLAIPMGSIMAMLGMQRAMFVLQASRILTISLCIYGANAMGLEMTTALTAVSCVWSLAYAATITMAFLGIKAYDRKHIKMREGEK